MSEKKEEIVVGFAIIRPKFNEAGFETGFVVKRRAPTAEHLLGRNAIEGDFIVEFCEIFFTFRPGQGPADHRSRILLHQWKGGGWKPISTKEEPDGSDQRHPS